MEVFREKRILKGDQIVEPNELSSSFFDDGGEVGSPKPMKFLGSTWGKE